MVQRKRLLDMTTQSRLVRSRSHSPNSNTKSLSRISRSNSQDRSNQTGLTNSCAGLVTAEYPNSFLMTSKQRVVDLVMNCVPCITVSEASVVLYPSTSSSADQSFTNSFVSGLSDDTLSLESFTHCRPSSSFEGDEERLIDSGMMDEVTTGMKDRERAGTKRKRESLSNEFERNWGESESDEDSDCVIVDRAGPDQRGGVTTSLPKKTRSNTIVID